MGELDFVEPVAVKAGHFAPQHDATTVLPVQLQTPEEYLTKQIIFGSIDALGDDLKYINRKIHENPELGYCEFQAHENIVNLMKTHNVKVTPHAFGLPTAFLAEYGSGGRVVTFCAEYDALPNIGHACGHNLIATSAIASFFGVVAALKASKGQVPGRVRLLGTPAEEGGAGKVKLIHAGAFADVDAAIMSHPAPSMPDAPSSLAGVAYGTCFAMAQFRVTFTGKAAHAGLTPWLGINALDAASLAYTAVGLLRQQRSGDDRINIIIKEGGARSGVIPSRAVVECGARSTSLKKVLELKGMLDKCFEGAAIATGCTVETEDTMETYAELRPNKTLCTEFAGVMAQEFGRHFICDLANKHSGGYGTDMGNVSHACPSFHGGFIVPSLPGENLHGPGFARAAGAPEAHEIAVTTGKGMAMVGWKVLADDKVARQIQEDFKEDRLQQ